MERRAEDTSTKDQWWKRSQRRLAGRRLRSQMRKAERPPLEKTAETRIPRCKEEDDRVQVRLPNSSVHSST